ncbi:helix-turn-helix domain-containing protein [Salinarimonas sp.]|uniref:helix-turn-helix domain-containing protein n=1 Tax=Salinarimonas sp. TaxID=2766526 RepID=UPI0032D8BEC0
MIIARWSHPAQRAEVATILPDGCVDLILVRDRDGRVRPRVSALMDGPTPVRIAAGAAYHGFRLLPGARIDATALSAAAAAAGNDEALLLDRLPEFAFRSQVLADALAHLAQARSVTDAAGRAGVRARTLQRVTLRETSRGPDFWRRLARARRAARRAIAGEPLADIAADEGYCDQAHMTRELVRWFGASPWRLARDARLAAQLAEVGYA